MTDGLSYPDILVATKKHLSSVSNKHPADSHFPWVPTVETKVIDICSPSIEQEIARSQEYQGQQQGMTTQSTCESREVPRAT